MEKHPAAPSWRLIGTAGEGAVLPQALHGLRRRQERDQQAARDYMLYGPIFVADFRTRTCDRRRDSGARLLDALEAGGRWPCSGTTAYPSRPILEPAAVARQRDQAADAVRRLHRRIQRAGCERSPSHVSALVFVIKRFYDPDWGERLARALQRRHRQRRSRATS